MPEEITLEDIKRLCGGATPQPPDDLPPAWKPTKSPRRPLLLEPIVDRDKLARKAKLVKKIRLEATRREPMDPQCPACEDYREAKTLPGFVDYGTGPNHFVHDCGRMPWIEIEALKEPEHFGDPDGLIVQVPDPVAMCTKPETHAGHLNGLVYRLQKDPADKGTLAQLLYEVHDDAALEIFPGKFAEGLTVNESWTAKDTAAVIKTAQRIAALPESDIPWPVDSDHTIEAAALRAQARRLAGMPEEMVEELAWQHEHLVPGTTEPAAQEAEQQAERLEATHREPVDDTACEDYDAALAAATDPIYVLGLIERIDNSDERDGLDAANELLHAMYLDKSAEEITIAKLVSKARTWAINAAMEQERAAAQEQPTGYLDTESEEGIVHPVTGESEYEDRPENQPDRMIGERGGDQLKFRDMLDDLDITIDELEAFAQSHNLSWPGCDDAQIATEEWETAMSDLAVLYGVETGQCNKRGRMIPDEPAAMEPEPPDYLDTEAPEEEVVCPGDVDPDLLEAYIDYCNHRSDDPLEDHRILRLFRIFGIGGQELCQTCTASLDPDGQCPNCSPEYKAWVEGKRHTRPEPAAQEPEPTAEPIVDRDKLAKKAWLLIMRVKIRSMSQPPVRVSSSSDDPQ